MFPGDPILELELAHQRMAERERWAEIMRLVREAQPTQPGMADRVLWGLGVLLIRLGQWLRDHAVAESPREQFPSW